MNWLKENKIPALLHDYKKSGISKEKLIDWCTRTGWEVLLNKKSTTWRELPADIQEKITDQESAIQLMKENTSIIKRPVIEYGNNLMVGFNETVFTKQLK